MKRTIKIQWAEAEAKERALKDAQNSTPMERALAMMPKKLNVKPEPTYKFNPHLPGTKL
jgi:hypothetical protein